SPSMKMGESASHERSGILSLVDTSTAPCLIESAIKLPDRLNQRQPRQDRAGRQDVTALAVLKGAGHRLPAFPRIHACIVSAGQGRADVPPYPWRSPGGSARVFYKCSLRGALRGVSIVLCHAMAALPSSAGQPGRQRLPGSWPGDNLVGLV